MEDNELLDFNWDNLDDPLNEEETTVETSKNTKETEEENTEETKSKEETKDELDDFNFETIVPDDIDKESKPENSEEVGETNTSIYTDLYQDLKTKGIFKHSEISEDEDLDEDKFFELQQNEIESEITERLKAWADNELDEDARAFIKFKREGGNTQQFFEVYSRSSGLPEGDITDDEFQNDVIRYQLQSEGWDDEEIEDRIEVLTDNGRKQKFAEKYYQRITEEKEEEKRILLEQAENQRKLIQERQNKFKSDLKDSLTTVNEIKGFKISEEDKRNIFKFFTKEEHKLEDNRMVTGFQKKLGEIFKDKEKMILLGKLMESDFDFSSLEQKIATKKVKQVKSKLEQRKGTRPSNSGSSLRGKSLADLFD